MVPVKIAGCRVHANFSDVIYPVDVLFFPGTRNFAKESPGAKIMWTLVDVEYLITGPVGIVVSNPRTPAIACPIGIVGQDLV